MLRLDKTVSRKTTLHADQESEDVENRARWQAMSFAEKREIVWYLQQQRQTLQALCEQGQWDAQNKNVFHSENGESAK